ncbi:hypothetical protein ADIAG_03088 [Paeniglutamicibacter gangotriensis Lz1y]|uniref:Uncharacterized protein n=1 Tax=Paeniglutamicibacter gangotriensis Lz1y TaxID=1276920 RepID=M7NGS1_9MICC|nr:hypothetical protein ADIAG_03088 [Paeniglutamicibacter gangotriensis Lz1y]
MVRVRPDGGRLPFVEPPLVRSDALDESYITLLEKALNLESEAVIEGRRTDNGPG